MRVLLVAGTPAEHAPGSPGSVTRDFAFGSYNYAIGLLKACALSDPVARDRVEIQLYDLPLARSQRTLSSAQLASLESTDPEVLGLSCYCWSRDVLLAAAASLKRQRPKLRVIAGGPSVSFDAKALLLRHLQLDMIVRGEAESAFVELCRRGFEQGWEIPNVSARNAAGEVLEHPEDRLEEALGSLPSPYLTGHLRPSVPSLLLEPSRGCRYRCSFCAWSTRKGPLRRTAPAKLAAEVRWALEQGYSGLNFCDTAINHDTDSLRDLCSLLRQEDPDQRLSLSVFVRHENLDQEQLALLAGLRCEELILGLESIHPAALRACGKAPLAIEQFEQRLSALQSAGLRATLSILSGLPGDTVESFRATLDYLEGLLERYPDAVNFICCFWLAVLPGTILSAKAQDYGFETLQSGTPYLLRSRSTSTEDLVAMARLLWERVERDPRFRCEEIHREVAERGLLEQSSSEEASAKGTQGPLSSAERAPRAHKENDFAWLLKPWQVGQGRGAWRYDETSTPHSEEGLVRYRFVHLKTLEEVLVLLSPRDPVRPCFARTQHYNVYYHINEHSRLPPTALDALLAALLKLLQSNEREGSP